MEEIDHVADLRRKRLPYREHLATPVEVLELARRIALGERADGKWSAPTVGLVVGRQNGKNSVLEARELVGLFLLGEKVIVHSALEQATSSEHFRRLLELQLRLAELCDTDAHLYEDAVADAGVELGEQVVGDT